jgi:hypothetical protein
MPGEHQDVWGAGQAGAASAVASFGQMPSAVPPVSDTPEILMLSSTAADNSPPRSKTVRIAAASASLTTNIPGAWGRAPRPASASADTPRSDRCSDRGRDADYSAPPAQNRAGPTQALGSHLGCLTAKRSLGQGWRIRGRGSQSPANFPVRLPAHGVLLTSSPKRGRRPA